LLILGIETSCDETAVAVVRDGREMLSSAIASQVEEHAKYGGVVPEIASRRHSEVISQVLKKALEDAGIVLDNIDAVAVTYAPGLIGSLLVGVNYAKGLCLAKRIPLIPVHHLRAHIAANYICNKELEPPFLCLVVSGGHSHIVQANDYVNFEVLGRTKDDAAGEAFDKTARALGLPYPGGVFLDKIADKGNPKAFKLPSPKVEGHPLDMSFSGLKTSVINSIHNAKQKGEELEKADMAASVRCAIIDILTSRLMLAAQQIMTEKIVLAGGVSANSLLRKKLSDLCDKANIKLFMPTLSLCGDNAAMVASQGYYELAAGNIARMDLNATATIPIDA